MLLPKIVMASVLFVCGQVYEAVPSKAPTAAEDIASHPHLSRYAPTNIDTRFVYADASGHYLIIENSLPRGGMIYKDFIGAEYVYAVFWTRIINETDHPFAWAMEFPEDSYGLPSSPGRYFKLLIPSDTMAPEQEPLSNYGLDVENYLDHSLYEKRALKRSINPKDSSSFYVVTLFNKGVDGTLRTGLSIKEEHLFYSVNDKKILCGKVNLKDLKLQE